MNKPSFTVNSTMPVSMEQPETLSEVQQEISFLARVSEQLECNLSTLRGSLNPVLREDTKAGEGSCIPDVSLCTLAMQIRHQRRSIEFANAQVENILSLLEL